MKPGFVISQLAWHERDHDAFDVDGDGFPDNQLGELSSRLAELNLVSQYGQDRLIARGELLLVAELEASDEITAADATFSLYPGRTPMPAPCLAPDVDCGQHLMGTGTVVVDSVRSEPLRGSIVQRTFTSERGELPLQFSILGSPPIAVTLRGAQVQVIAPSLGGLFGALGGAILESEIETKVYPALLDGLHSVIRRDCAPQGSPPSCGCRSFTTGASLIQLLDASPADCSLSVARSRRRPLL